MLRKGLIKPPTLRSGQVAETERHATWLELFYDLVFVAAISQLAGNLNRDYSSTGLLHFAILLCQSGGMGRPHLLSDPF